MRDGSRAPWQELLAYSETYTCYSSAIATWAAVADGGWESVVNAGLWLALTEPVDGLFGFSHFPPGTRERLRLGRRSTNEGGEAIAAIEAELERMGRVILAGDGRRLPWHVAYNRRPIPHWFVVVPHEHGFEVIDPFACRNDLGWQKPARHVIPKGVAADLIVALEDDPVFRLRESLALGDEAGSPLARYQWFEVLDLDAPGMIPAVRGAAAIRLLADHFHRHGQSPAAYRQVDDIWSIGRHRSFLAHYARVLAEQRRDNELRRWVVEHAEPLARRWAHMPPLLMQATLALDSNRTATPSVPETLAELAERETAAAEAAPTESEYSLVSSTALGL